jgi:protein-S-isoprenylcysteine O-methyltransferase Ste14
MLAAAAVLLSVERICYVVVWRAPELFRAWCRRSVVADGGDPIDVLAMLFGVFKALQIAVFLAWCYVHGDGSLRPPASSAWVLAAGGSLVAAGQFLSASVFSRLGKTGVFYRNKLGREIPWCSTFPFTWFRHPQYVGTVVSIWGFFLVMRFPATDWIVLPLLETIYYVAGAHLEQDRESPPVVA